MARLKLLEGATWQYAGLGPKGPTGATGPNGSIGVTGSTVEQLKTRAYDLLAMKQRIDTEFKSLAESTSMIDLNIQYEDSGLGQINNAIIEIWRVTQI